MLWIKEAELQRRQFFNPRVQRRDNEIKMFHPRLAIGEGPVRLGLKTDFQICRGQKPPALPCVVAPEVDVDVVGHESRAGGERLRGVGE